MFACDNYSKNTNINKVYNAGLYLRLSKEDELTGQSASINNQKEFVASFVISQNWNIADIYIEACDIIEPTQKTA